MTTNNVVELIIRARNEVTAPVGKARAALAEFNKVVGDNSRVASSAAKQIAVFVAGFAGVAALKSFGQSMLQGAASVESMRKSLEVTYGSVEKANKMFALFDATARKVPFTLDDVTSAAVTLQNFSKDIDLTTWMTPLMDLAAKMRMQNPYLSMGEISGNLGRSLAGGIGGADLLRETGITGLIAQFAKLKYGIDDITKVSAPQFRKIMYAALTDTSLGIAGMTKNMMSTWQGMKSNLTDTWLRIQRTIMNGGLFEWMKSQLSELLATIKKLEATGELRQWSEEIGRSLVRAGEAAKTFGSILFKTIGIMRDFHREIALVALTVAGLSVFVKVTTWVAGLSAAINILRGASAAAVAPVAALAGAETAATTAGVGFLAGLKGLIGTSAGLAGWITVAIAAADAIWRVADAYKNMKGAENRKAVAGLWADKTMNSDGGAESRMYKAYREAARSKDPEDKKLLADLYAMKPGENTKTRDARVQDRLNYLAKRYADKYGSQSANEKAFIERTGLNFLPVSKGNDEITLAEVRAAAMSYRPKKQKTTGVSPNVNTGKDTGKKQVDAILEEAMRANEDYRLSQPGALIEEFRKKIAYTAKKGVSTKGLEREMSIAMNEGRAGLGATVLDLLKGLDDAAKAAREKQSAIKEKIAAATKKTAEAFDARRTMRLEATAPDSFNLPLKEKELNDWYKEQIKTFGDSKELHAAYFARLKQLYIDHAETRKKLDVDYQAFSYAQLQKMLSDTATAEEKKVKIREEMNRRIQDNELSTMESFTLGWQDATARFASNAEIMVSLGRSAADRIRSGFSDTFFAFFKGDIKSLGDLWRSFCNDMRDAYLRAISDMMAKKAAAALFGDGSGSAEGGGTVGSIISAVSGMFGGGGGGGGAVSVAQSIGKSLLSPVKLFASGGIATRPTPGVFGEAGPEALIPLNSSRAAAMLGGGGNAGPVIHINGPYIASVSAIDSASFAEHMANNSEMITGIVDQGIRSGNSMLSSMVRNRG